MEDMQVTLCKLLFVQMSKTNLRNHYGYFQVRLSTRQVFFMFNGLALRCENWKSTPKLASKGVIVIPEQRYAVDKPCKSIAIIIDPNW